MAEARNFKSGAQIDRQEYYRKNAKLGQIDTHPTSRDLLLNFGTASIHISGTAEARNFKFGAKIGRMEYYRKKCQIRSIGYTAYVT